ncbi:hypothetical protein PsAD2_03990 [Pseudovibrio axinellae]|uniref:Uncharacterized protein n=1 Tax=Pseudovibrio axinellae TaxID=989403 RepID=A0A165U9K0_9HYPH|nr:hypothetical protein PsAD2_03990 [Pseudovibrio axinellae]
MPSATSLMSMSSPERTSDNNKAARSCLGAREMSFWIVASRWPWGRRAPTMPSATASLACASDEQSAIKVSIAPKIASASTDVALGSAVRVSRRASTREKSTPTRNFLSSLGSFASNHWAASTRAANSPKCSSVRYSCISTAVSCALIAKNARWYSCKCGCCASCTASRSLQPLAVAFSWKARKRRKLSSSILFKSGRCSTDGA